MGVPLSFLLLVVLVHGGNEALERERVDDALEKEGVLPEPCTGLSWCVVVRP